jgi:hypothetical protein
MIRKKLSELNETLLDLIIGIIIFDVIAGILGMIIVQNKLYYLIGIGAGMIEAVIFSFLMLYYIDGALDMEPKSANAYMVKGSIIRYVVMIITAAIAINLHVTCFAGVILALMGIKAAAFMQPFVNKSITKKLLD